MREADAGGYVLSGTDAAGAPVEITLTTDDLLDLVQRFRLIEDRLLQSLRRTEGSAVPLTRTRVQQVVLNTDLLTGEIVLRMVGESGIEVAFLLPDEVAEPLAERLPVRLAQAKAKRPKPQ
jgi:hypothetical protein